ncbi:hypothetical protein KO528_01725 [Saccharophagus degradans]|uniref:hypothetical protein n=1 Tax=Saccharophagus degradans TaxID=86304 RepID=UPI001C09A065|nr:hypothetical protein [Saccharophagus degradans]MBU2984056.1 hypothetical protein [Saccharophagus degradans]
MTNGNNKEIFKICSEGDELEKLEQLIAAGADIEAIEVPHVNWCRAREITG